MDDHLVGRVCDEIVSWPARHILPVMIGVGSDSVIDVRNGTATLVRLQDRCIAVTCEHVVRQYRSLAESNPDARLQVGDAIVNAQHVIGACAKKDLATIDLTEFLSCFSRDVFCRPRAWPEGEVVEADVVSFGGFPGAYRKHPGERIQFHTHSAMGEVSSSNELHVYTRLELEQGEHRGPLSDKVGDVGGISGGPVFVAKKGDSGRLPVPKLAGFVIEYQQEYDLLFCSVSRCIEENGAILDA